MKKIFTLLMAMVVAAAMYALPPVELGKKVAPTGHATKMVEKKLQHHQQMAKALGLDRVERKAAVKVTPEAKANAPQAQNEVIHLYYDAFAGMESVDEEIGEWWIGLSCDDWSRPEYGHNISLDWYAEGGNPCGTFTTEDFVADYTYMMTPTGYGSILFDEITMTVAKEVVSANLERYILDATLVASDGNTYVVHAVHENIVPMAEVAVYIEDATMTQDMMSFTVEGQNEDLDFKLVVNNYEYVGVYGMGAIDWENSTIAYKGTAVAPITFKAIVNLATHTETGELAYVTEVKMLGKDTVDYHIILAAPLSAPTDTVELTAYDLTVDDTYAMWFGMVDFYATTPEFSIRGGWQAEYAEEGTYAASIFLDDANWNTITSLNAEVIVTLDNDNNWVIEATMLGSDNKVYNLHLRWFIPEAKDTVVVAFENSAQAKYYPHLDNDIQIYNENERYRASINVSGVELGGEFDGEYVIDYFSYLEAVNGKSITVAEIKNGRLYQVGDTTKIEADYMTFEGILYQVRLWYVAPTPTETVVLDIEDAELIVDYDYNQAYNLIGYTEDMQTAFVVTMYATSKDDVAGTFVNDGMFGKFGEGQYEFDASNSYVGKYNAEWEAYDLYYVQKGQLTVTLDEEDNMLLTASVVCADAIQYEVTLTSKYVEPHIDFDSEDSPVDRVYGADAEVSINDYTEDYGLVSVQIIDEVVGDITALYFVLTEADEETIIPLGSYPINMSWMDGTVLASSGMDWDGNVIPSYYAGYTDGWLEEPFYFFQEGEVVVSKNAQGKLAIEINALNSCKVPVHILYNPSEASGVENTHTAVEVRKQILNGQLLIVRDGKSYNAVGVQVK